MVRNWARIIAISLLVLSNTATLFGQKKLYQGIIIYKVTKMEGISVEDTSKTFPFEDMFMKITFKADLFRSDLNLGIQEMSKIENTENKMYFLLFDLGERKIAIKTTKEEMEAEEDNLEYTIAYTKETKKIAGYKCRKAILHYDKGLTSTLYYSKKLTFGNKDHKREFDKIEGIVMEYQQITPVGSITFTLDKIELIEINEEVFNIPQDYEILTLQEFQNIMMGINNPGAN